LGGEPIRPIIEKKNVDYDVESSSKNSEENGNKQDFDTHCFHLALISSFVGSGLRDIKVSIEGLVASCVSMKRVSETQKEKW
jgi:hypothetical protein